MRKTIFFNVILKWGQIIPNQSITLVVVNNTHLKAKESLIDKINMCTCSDKQNQL